MKTPHTPGPWSTRRMNDETVIILGDHKGQTACLAHSFETVDDEANTRLISAAPDLLEALQQLRGVFSEAEWMALAPVSYKQALDAIARAVGE